MAKVDLSSKISIIVADWRTGNYTQRELAHKHKVSNGFIAKHTKGVAQDNEQLVSIGVQYRQGLAELDEQSVSSVSNAVDEITKHIQFFNHAAITNVKQSLAMPCENQNDFRARADTINKGREAVLGKSPDTAIQVNTGTQISEIRRTIVRPGD